MVRESLPIKCMEAVILAIYLTNGIPGLGRFPINFKSEVNEVSLLKGRKFYYHVVLGVAYKVIMQLKDLTSMFTKSFLGKIWCYWIIKKKFSNV